MKVASLGREAIGTCQPDALRGACDEYSLAGESKFHDGVPGLLKWRKTDENLRQRSLALLRAAAAGAFADLRRAEPSIAARNKQKRSPADAEAVASIQRGVDAARSR